MFRTDTDSFHKKPCQFQNWSKYLVSNNGMNFPRKLYHRYLKGEAVKAESLALRPNLDK